jgi:hypothetical protein
MVLVIGANRIVAPAGRTRLSASGIMRDTGEPDVVAGEAQQHAVTANARLDLALDEAAAARDEHQLITGVPNSASGPSRLSNAPLTRLDFNCCHGDGSSNEPSLGSTEIAA